MSKKSSTGPVLGPKAMEMVMRDVLGGMQDLAVMKSFESISNVFEIISIIPCEDTTDDYSDNDVSNDSAEIIPFVGLSKG